MRGSSITPPHAYREMHRLELQLTSAARAKLIDRGFSPDFGARHLGATLERVCNVEVAKKLRRDDARSPADRGALVDWLREIRSGQRAFDLDEVKQRVLGATRTRLPYDTVRVDFRDGEFFYDGLGGEEA